MDRLSKLGLQYRESTELEVQENQEGKTGGLILLEIVSKDANKMVLVADRANTGPTVPVIIFSQNRLSDEERRLLSIGLETQLENRTDQIQSLLSGVLGEALCDRQT